MKAVRKNRIRCIKDKKNERKRNDSFRDSRSLGYEFVIERTLLARKRRVEASTKS